MIKENQQNSKSNPFPRITKLCTNCTKVESHSSDNHSFNSCVVLTRRTPTYIPDEGRPGRRPQKRTSPPQTLSPTGKQTRWPTWNGGGDVEVWTWFWLWAVIGVDSAVRGMKPQASGWGGLLGRCWWKLMGRLCCCCGWWFGRSLLLWCPLLGRLLLLRWWRSRSWDRSCASEPLLRDQCRNLMWLAGRKRPQESGQVKSRWPLKEPLLVPLPTAEPWRTTERWKERTRYLLTNPRFLFQAWCDYAT